MRLGTKRRTQGNCLVRIRARSLVRALVTTAVVAGIAVPAAGASVGLRAVGTFREPVYVTSPPGDPGSVAVVERYGTVRLVPSGRGRPRTLLDLRREVRIDDPNETIDQRGLLSIAFPPDYRRSRRIYVDYVDRSGRLRVGEARSAKRVRPILDLGEATTQHHGGQLQFAGSTLYVSTGMGDDERVSQQPEAFGGKILRFDPRKRPVRPEVVALGLRNPWRFSIHRGTVLIGDVGGDEAEEVNLTPSGASPPVNFGWPFFEGFEPRSSPELPIGPVTAPALVKPHSSGWCSIVGGYVSRDRAVPSLRGRYVYGDVCSGRIRSARLRGNRLVDDRSLPIRVPYLVSFGQDGLGRLYAVSLNGGVWRIVRS